MKNFAINWVVEDGYAGKSRPHRTIIDADELADMEEWDDVKKYIEESVQSQFEQTVYPVVNTDVVKGEWMKLRSDHIAAK